MNKYKINVGKELFAAYIFPALIGFVIFGVFLIISALFSGEVGGILAILIMIPYLFGVIFIIGIGVVFRVLYLNSLQYSNDKDNFTFKGGIISRFERILPFSRIQHVIISQSLFQRMFGLSTITIQTAGQQGFQFQYNRKNMYRSDIPVVPGLMKEDSEKFRDDVVKWILSKEGERDI